MDNIEKIKNLSAIAYKLLTDILFLLLAVYFFLLVSEAVLPGFVSARLSFTKLTLLVLADLAAIAYLGKKNNFIQEDSEIKNKKLIFIFAFLFAALAANSLLKFGVAENLIITLSALAILFYFFKIFKT